VLLPTRPWLERLLGVFGSWYQNYLGWNDLLDGIILDGMVEVECLISCTDMLYKMIHNFVWLDK
jgi:hypothetical protein